MVKKEKLLDKLLRKPSDFTFRELESLLGHFGYDQLKPGKTGGSRRAFLHRSTKHIIRLHKPHKGNTLKQYQIREIIQALKKNDHI
jgi:hypothetical protein